MLNTENGGNLEKTRLIKVSENLVNEFAYHNGHVSVALLICRNQLFFKITTCESSHRKSHGTCKWENITFHKIPCFPQLEKNKGLEE